MGQKDPPASAQAFVLASSLEDLADRLGSADSAAAFVAALDENRVLWQQVRLAADRFGWALPRRFLDLSNGAAAKATRRAVSDHDVEAIIAINRAVSTVIRAEQ